MEEFICPVCLDLLNVPVTLVCGHNFCKSCIDTVWESEKQPSCPQCREDCRARKYAVNRLLANVIKRVQIQCRTEEGPSPCQNEQLCWEHKKSLELFCDEDKSLLCSQCVPEHHGHTFLTVNEALDVYKNKVMAFLCRQESSLKYFKEIQCQQERKMSEVTAISSGLQQSILSEFEKLHQFLHEKEKHLVQQLKEEEKGILRQMGENLKKIKEDINAIQESVSNTQLQQQLQQQDTVTFLKEIKSFTERLKADKAKGDRQSIVDLSLTTGVYKGPLQYSVWKEMKSILNPDLSNLSIKIEGDEDLNLEGQANLTNPFLSWLRLHDKCVSELGSEGFKTGRHYCEVEVGNMTQWTVGVTTNCFNWKKSFAPRPQDEYWTLSFINGNEYMTNESLPKFLILSVKPQKIGVYVDCNEGQVSFYNANDMSHIYTFTGISTVSTNPIFRIASFNFFPFLA
ncbi:zinc-binding protein A33-like [Protopterus annectens]|uniref:zinc-binding protein A33-like n=1 Tax=Protopterus annectens TaxID=7888 RepID=UPI001CFA8F5A|nr:zinc-binding protein A33-like [Protopterus annectens]